MAKRKKYRTAYEPKRYGLIDLETGEKFEGVITPWLPKIRGEWVRVFQKSKADLIKRSHLHGQSYHILSCLDTVVSWGNEIPAPPAIAKDFSLPESAVYRAYAELIKADIVIRENHSYYLNVLYCWKGSPQELAKAQQRLLLSRDDTTSLTAIL